MAGSSAGIDEGKVFNRFLIILATPERLAVGVQHLEPQDLKSEGNQFGQIRDMGVFLVQQREHVLRQVFGLFPRYT